VDIPRSGICGLFVPWGEIVECIELVGQNRRHENW
jgi:hypothetical protein